MAGINLDVSGLKVLLEPVSAQTFSLTVPSAVPAVVEVLATGPQGPGVPFFGNTDDVLVKASDVSFDTEWTDEITVDAVQFDVAADEGEPVTGQLVWNAEEGTLDLGLNGVEGTFLHVGQEEMFRVSNRTGATIAKGKVVGFGGTIGQSGKLLGCCSMRRLLRRRRSWVLLLTTFRMMLTGMWWRSGRFGRSTRRLQGGLRVTSCLLIRRCRVG
jgi:hypothetical protein